MSALLSLGSIFTTAAPTTDPDTLYLAERLTDVSNGLGMAVVLLWLVVIALVALLVWSVLR